MVTYNLAVELGAIRTRMVGLDDSKVFAVPQTTASLPFMFSALTKWTISVKRYLYEDTRILTQSI